MAPDTSRPRYASFVPDGLTQIQTPDPDRCDAEPTPPHADRDTLPEYPPIESIPGLVPQPPSRRGWYTHRGTTVPIEVPHGLFTDAVNSLRHYDHLVDPRANDATFENEVRPL